MTRAAFHEMFARCDTRSEIEELIALTAKRVAPREQIALQVAGTRRCMEILFKDLKVWIQELFDETNAPLEAIDRRLTAKDHEQDQRLEDLDGRVARLESRPRRTSK